MGGGGVPSGGRPNQTAYFVALGGIAVLLLLLCCYFCYFFISKVKELSEQETPSTTPSASRQRGPTPYPVQPVIRDSASAMAKLCKQLPPAPPPAGKGDTVFPTSTSPAALQTDTGCGLPAAAAGAGAGAPDAGAPVSGADVCDKLAPPSVTADTVISVEAAS